MSCQFSHQVSLLCPIFTHHFDYMAVLLYSSLHALTGAKAMPVQIRCYFFKSSSMKCLKTCVLLTTKDLQSCVCWPGLKVVFLLQLAVRYPCYLRLFWWGLETLASNDQYWTLLGFLRETFAVPGVCWNVSCTILSLPLISRKRQCCVCTSPCPESTYLFYYDPFYGAG